MMNAEDRLAVRKVEEAYWQEWRQLVAKYVSKVPMHLEEELLAQMADSSVWGTDYKELVKDRPVTLRINHNQTTGIAFGYVAANELDPELVDQLFGGGVNHTYEEYKKEAEGIAKSEWENEAEEKSARCAEEGTDCVLDDFEFDEDKFNDGYESGEEDITGVHEGVSYRTSWLGGALNFWIFESPVTTDKAIRASPCVPNAAVLKKDMDGSVEGYSVPQTWWRTE